MNSNRQAAVMTEDNKESTMKITAARLISWAGLAAMLSGILFIVIQTIHPLDVLSSVTTAQWAIAHYLGVAMSVLGLLGITGIYARQAKAAGWLGLVGYLLFSIFYTLSIAFQFAEAFIVPLLAAAAPTFVEGWLTIPNGQTTEVNLGALPAIYALTGFVGYVLGGLLFGIATLRAGVLPRWAAGLLAFAAVSPPLLATLLPHPLDRILAVPMGLALAWLGYALWSKRGETVTEPVLGRGSPQLRQTGAE